jgi:hypothetical protein
MKVFKKKVDDLESAGWNHGLLEFSPKKIPCESNCPYMMITDTLNCRKEFEGLTDIEEVRRTGRCSFGPHKYLENH